VALRWAVDVRLLGQIEVTTKNYSISHHLSVANRCHNPCRTEKIDVGEGEAQELEDARWFTLEEARQAMIASMSADSFMKSTEVRLPPPMAIAHQLVRAWIERNSS